MANEITKAFFNIMSEIRPVKKDAKNPFFKSNYANLNSVLKAITPAIMNNGCYCQTPTFATADKDTIGIEVVLTHAESGEQIRSQTIMPMTKFDPQAAGSAISYARRYALVAFFNLDQTDDDAELAMGRNNSKPSYTLPAQARPEPLMPNLIDEADAEYNKMTHDMKVNECNKLMDELGFDDDRKLKAIQYYGGGNAEFVDVLTDEQLKKLRTQLRTLKTKANKKAVA